MLPSANQGNVSLIRIMSYSGWKNHDDEFKGLDKFLGGQAVNRAVSYGLDAGPIIGIIAGNAAKKQLTEPTIKLGTAVRYALGGGMDSYTWKDGTKSYRYSDGDEIYQDKNGTYHSMSAFNSPNF